jgi:hypothetical protein
MPDDQPQGLIPADQQVSTNERLWSEEVGLARAGEALPPKDPAYEWSNGRVHVEGNGPYGNNA